MSRYDAVRQVYVYDPNEDDARRVTYDEIVREYLWTHPDNTIEDARAWADDRMYDIAMGDC